MSKSRDIALHGAKAFNKITQRPPSHEDSLLKSAQIFYKALVTDTISDPSLERDEDSLPDMSESQIKEFFNAPRNSLICRLITGAEGVSNESIICYPFFSSHIALIRLSLIQLI